MYPKKQLAQLVISACEHFGINKVVLSPGSRNAPLTVGFSNHKKIKTYSIIDERCAAFFALGIAQQSRKPVAIVCTSGSALLNYYPAIAESFYSNIPLVIISADRPKHLIDIGDGQTIRQENVYKNHILYSANLVEDKDQLENNTTLICKAFQTAIDKKGPIHINVPFDEPLYETVATLTSFNFEEVKQQNIQKNKIAYNTFSEIWNTSNRKLILVGVNFPSKELQTILDAIIEDETVLVMTETTSNMYNPNFINGIDQLISKLEDSGFKNLQPDVLVTLGGMVVSKRVKQFLRKYQPKNHWHIDEHTKLDTYFSLDSFIKENPSVFLVNLLSTSKKIMKKQLVKQAFSYQKKWLLEKENRIVKHTAFMKNAAYSDIKVVGDVLASIPSNSQLQISNSSIIRYAQLFKLNNTLQVFCNRGTSGIDGSTSTAIGASLASEKQTILITGDLSFFYDSNALWNNYIPKNFRIILINNSGGGIFKIIPGPKSTNALSYFETPHSLTAQYLSKMYDFEYTSVNSLTEVTEELKNFYIVSKRPKILEIFTPSHINDVALQQYFKHL